MEGGEKLPTGGAFDGARAAELTAELRKGFNSGRTRSYEWRAEQMKGIARMIEEKEAEIMAALNDDLAKPHLESFLHERSIVMLCDSSLYARNYNRQTQTLPANSNKRLDL